MNVTGPPRSVGGYTLMELLVVIGVLAILLGITASQLGQLRQRSLVSSAAQTLAQDINVTRARTIANGTVHRVVFVDASTYRIDRFAGDWVAERTVSLPVVALGGFASGSYLRFETTGTAWPFTAADIPASGTLTSITATKGSLTRTVRITLIGLAREVGS